MRGPKVVMIGGGTGSFTLLRVLKDYVQDITALVNMADDGGSTGVLRDELGALPPGDVRQCLVALSRSSDQMRELFNYRFPEGTFEGHSFGNLFLTAVEKMSNDNFSEAVSVASHVLDIQGRVIPMTLDDIRLMIKFSDGTVEKGEINIGHMDFKGKLRPDISLKPSGKINPEAKEAIEAADIIVIAPGNLYGSIGPALIIGGVKEALTKSKARLVYVCNLMTKPGQTDGFDVRDYAGEIERFIRVPRLDYVLYNNRKPDSKLVDKYSAEKEFPVGWDEKKLAREHYKAVGNNFVSSIIHHKNSSDTLKSENTFIRHDSEAISKQLMKIFYSR